MKWRFEQEGIDIARVFSHFDTTPIASASLAQVYAATLKDRRKSRGKGTAAEDRRYHQRRSVRSSDGLPAIITQHFEEAKRWEPEGIIREFRRSIYKELDMRHEGRNADIFRNNFADDPTVYVPKIYWNLSSRAILVMEFIDGKRLSDCFDPASAARIAEKNRQQRRRSRPQADFPSRLLSGRPASRQRLCAR